MTAKTAIERQEADCRAWAERNGLTVRKVHLDRGRSGYKTVERKGFDAALAAVTAGVVGTLIVWKLDRLSRKGIGEVGKLLDEIEKAGGRIVSVLDGLDTSNDSERMVVAMLAELARSESNPPQGRVSWMPGLIQTYGYTEAVGARRVLERMPRGGASCGRDPAFTGGWQA
ncbi:recombinase family protein [Streptomyces sp. NPDC057193]|uniref:recombinase family protein n=1 Tax=Streptomyces sp. NPDC057193 TaxID=3346043 RepID=UPI00363B87F8